jgi:hypothetical protein
MESIKSDAGQVQAVSQLEREKLLSQPFSFISIIHVLRDIHKAFQPLSRAFRFLVGPI